VDLRDEYFTLPTSNEPQEFSQALLIFRLIPRSVTPLTSWGGDESAGREPPVLLWLRSLFFLLSTVGDKHFYLFSPVYLLPPPPTYFSWSNGSLPPHCAIARPWTRRIHSLMPFLGFRAPPFAFLSLFFVCVFPMDLSPFSPALPSVRAGNGFNEIRLSSSLVRLLFSFIVYSSYLSSNGSLFHFFWWGHHPSPPCPCLSGLLLSSSHFCSFFWSRRDKTRQVLFNRKELTFCRRTFFSPFSQNFRS